MAIRVYEIAGALNLHTTADHITDYQAGSLERNIWL